MIKTTRLLKVTMAWISIVYLICFGAVALFPGIRPSFMKYVLHMTMDTGLNVINFGTFITGLILWNIIALAAVWLFATLYNNFKE